MFEYILRRLGLMVLTLFGVSVAIFCCCASSPATSPTSCSTALAWSIRLRNSRSSRISASICRLVTQYAHWIGGLAHGDLGYSYVSEKPVLDEILPRIPITARLAGLALLFAVCTGVPFGVISAVRQNSGLDYVLRLFSLWSCRCRRSGWGFWC